MEVYLATAGVSTSSIILIGLLYKVWEAVKGRRLISDCCGKKLEVGIDVRDMPHTPEPPEMTSHLSRRGGTQEHHQQSEQNHSEHHQKAPEHHSEIETSKSVRMRLPQQVEEEDCVPECVEQATSVSKQSGNAKVLQNDEAPSLPPILLG